MSKPFKQRLTEAEYKAQLSEIQHRTDLSPIQRTMAINSLTRRFNNDVAYYTPDSSGYSQADRDALETYHKDLIWRAKYFGMDPKEAESSDNEALNRYIHAQEKLGRKIIYDESEIGSPDLTSSNSKRGESYE